MLLSALKNPQSVSIRKALIPGTIFVVLLWFIKSLEVQFDFSLHQLGVFPGSINGLVGIVTGPLIHGSFEHLASNSLPLLLLVTGLYYGYSVSKKWALALIWFGSGLGTWLFAREAWHFGASGLTHGLFFYLLVISILRRDKRSIALMMMAFFMYGGMTMTIFPREVGISFEYHFFGALFGVVGALIFRNWDPKPAEKKYSWELEDKEDELIGDQWQAQQFDVDKAKAPAENTNVEFGEHNKPH